MVQHLETHFRCTSGFTSGAAVTSINIEGVLHEFDTVPGVRERRYANYS